MNYKDSINFPVNLKLLTRLFSGIKVSTEYSYNGTPCWNWQRSLDKDGYGKTSIHYPRGHTQYWRTHRLFYCLFIEFIPLPMVPDHLCRNPVCCNPCHLEAVTPRINTLRGIGPSAINAVKTHCIRGHALVGGNLIPRKDKRDCRTCTNLMARKNETKRIRNRLYMRAKRTKLKESSCHK